MSNASAWPSTSTPSNRSSKTPEAAPVRRPKRYWILRFLGIALGLLVLLLCTIPMCRTSGNEFSPLSFQKRNFTIYRIPWVHLQFLPTFYSSKTSLDIAPEILGKFKTITQYEVWHTMETNSYGGDSFPVQLLLKAIQRKDSEYDSYWGAWSLKNPKLAAILWPIIQSMAIENLYHEIPQTLRFAEGYQGPEAGFEKALLSEIHSNLNKRQSVYSSSDPDARHFDRDSEGLPAWTKVQDWLQANPVPPS